MPLSNCVVCDKKKSTFIKNKELLNDYFKMNKIINKFLFRDTFMPEQHLKQPGYTYYSACGQFTKHCERIQKFIEIGDLKHLYRSELESLFCL